MGLPVRDQVDLVLPLLGLEAVLGAAVMANTTAAEDDDDGPHQPKPCSRGEPSVSHCVRAASKPREPKSQWRRSSESLDVNLHCSKGRNMC